ncbi:conserved hypothetical protein [Neospora caninum Liverpool]|uniref:Uncharacterized protein n=1 Tax=Neospora caninum (strain Liverpool) TaxID=572307 RepID=F0VRV0_NEOCL|nr:conserved hypothetical protein [Neospora caninum Liverpool]CBZ56448.1 conserved hypothetical protein [Neospora caninum Liverpool]CEL71207.1 TPA: hypothetical protein BN1204_068710 [Neospora caninum Liverpool]|eukprot:XP_003886473.1 conserved hypothetical protein [Neospora caninum Liverpool]
MLSTSDIVLAGSLCSLEPGLSLKNTSIGDTGVNVLTKIVGEKFAISHLDISGTRVSDNGVSRLCQEISQCSSIKTLALPAVGHDGLSSIVLMLESPGSKTLEKLSFQVDDKTTLSHVHAVSETDVLLQQLSEEVQMAETAIKKKLESQVEKSEEAANKEAGLPERPTEVLQRNEAQENTDADGSVGDNEAYQQSLLEREHLRDYGDASSPQVTSAMYFLQHTTTKS